VFFSAERFTYNFYALLEDEMDNYRLFNLIFFLLFPLSYAIALYRIHTFRGHFFFFSVYSNGNVRVGALASWRNALSNCLLLLFSRPSALVQKRENKVTEFHKI
jgi:hypothetical protein